MSDDKIPQRPDGVGDSFSHGSAPRVEVEPTPAHPASHMADAQPGYAASSTAAPSTETIKHTVVKTKTKKAPVFLASLGGLVVGSVLVIALVMSGAFKITDSDVQATGGQGSTQTIDINPEDTTLAEVVAAKAQPSVVSITATADNGGGVGSGVVLDTDGNILTNYHVIEGATQLAVSMGGESYEAELVGEDASSDLAVIRLKDVDSSKLTPIEIGDSDNLAVGEWVMAIGSPFGNEQSVSTGIVSALYRSTALPSTSGTSIYANMIQTDAAINPGNSGGALVNDEGELIGINSIIESYSGSSSGVGFAIPVNYAINIANQIVDGKTPVHPYLGVSLTSVNALSARANKLGATEGAMVVAVSDGGPAAEAGIKENDIITMVDGEKVASADGLIIALREHEVGDKVTLTVVRDSKEQEIEVTLGSDEALQTDQQDNSQGDTSGNSMTEEQFLQYLEELMGRGSNSGMGMGGNLG